MSNHIFLNIQNTIIQLEMPVTAEVTGEFGFVALVKHPGGTIKTEVGPSAPEFVRNVNEATQVWRERRELEKNV